MNVEHENISTFIHRKARIADLHQIIELLLEDELGGGGQENHNQLNLMKIT
jgi:hypothetical protein